jgi:adenosylhomocysteine nucleosidase
MEAEPFIKKLNMVQTEKTPFTTYIANDIVLAICGIGKANAAMATAYCCMKYQPGCILNAGAAGAVNKECEVGKIYQVEKTIEPDRPHLKTGTPWIQIPDTLEGFDSAVLGTQDKPIDDIETFNELSDLVDLVDMEGASILQAARRFDTKCLLFKFVSDTPLHAGKGLIVENIKKHISPFCDFIISSVIKFIEEMVNTQEKKANT